MIESLIKYLCFSALCIFSVLPTIGQTPLDSEGNQFKLSGGYSNLGIPVFISYEMGVLEDVSFGLEAGYRSYNEKRNDSAFAHNVIGMRFFSNYYFNKLMKIPAEKWFVYGGLNLGYYKWFSPDGYYSPGSSSSTLAIGAQIGGSVYFKDWGINLETSGGTENYGVRLGVIYRFGY